MSRIWWPIVAPSIFQISRVMCILVPRPFPSRHQWRLSCHFLKGLKCELLAGNFTSLVRVDVLLLEKEDSGVVLVSESVLPWVIQVWVEKFQFDWLNNEQNHQKKLQTKPFRRDPFWMPSTADYMTSWWWNEYIRLRRWECNRNVLCYIPVKSNEVIQSRCCGPCHLR